MRYKLTLFLLLALFACGLGCEGIRPKKAIVNITLENASIHDLAWVKIDWEGPFVPGGVMSPGVSSTAVSVEWPNLPGAKISFIDRKTRKPYSVEVSFASVNERILSGQCREVTIRILDYDKAEVNCE